MEAVEESLRDFTGDMEQNDDITVLSLFARRNPVLELDYDVREFAKIRECLLDSFLPKSLIMDLCVAAEECFVNICSYAFDGPAPEGEKILFSPEGWLDTVSSPELGDMVDAVTEASSLVLDFDKEEIPRTFGIFPLLFQ